MIRTIVMFSSLVFVVGCSSGDKPADSTVSDTPAERETGSKPSRDSEGQDDPQVAARANYDFVAPALSESELREGWVSLFDGSTLFGWDVPGETNWRVEDGCIVADEGEISLLSTPFHFDDFEFRCDFHLEKGGNSGVFLRTASDAANPAKDTYELNIADVHPSHPTGSLVGRYVAENVPAVEGEWHTFHVVCDGSRIEVRLDGKQIVDFDDQTPNARARGTIGLQMNSGRIAFRNVFLKPRRSQELFDGESLNGFRTVPGSVGSFVVVDNVIHAEGGPGFLETEAVFDDFILHVEANINDSKAIADGRPANSGVFFRAIEGSEQSPSHGYEMQIQHDFKGDDRSQPADFGSGGIYRREAARYVVADNNEWFTETLIAQGNRFATFVNGYQVLNWEDNRDPDANPRKGLRLDAGHLSLQGHDPTTMLDFRSLRIHKLRQSGD